MKPDVSVSSLLAHLLRHGGQRAPGERLRGHHKPSGRCGNVGPGPLVCQERIEEAAFRMIDGWMDGWIEGEKGREEGKKEKVRKFD